MTTSYLFPRKVSTVAYEHVWLLSLECCDDGYLFEKISSLMQLMQEKGIRAYGISIYQPQFFEKVNLKFDLDIEGSDLSEMIRKLPSLTGIPDFGHMSRLFESRTDHWALYIEQYPGDFAIFHFKDSLKKSMHSIFDEEWINRWVLSPEEVWSQVGYLLKPELKMRYREELFKNFGVVTRILSE